MWVPRRNPREATRAPREWSQPRAVSPPCALRHRPTVHPDAGSSARGRDLDRPGRTRCPADVPMPTMKDCLDPDCEPIVGPRFDEEAEAVLALRRALQTLPERVGPFTRLRNTGRAVCVQHWGMHHRAEHFPAECGARGVHDSPQQQLPRAIPWSAEPSITVGRVSCRARRTPRRGLIP